MGESLPAEVIHPQCHDRGQRALQAEETLIEAQSTLHITHNTLPIHTTMAVSMKKCRDLTTGENTNCK